MRRAVTIAAVGLSLLTAGPALAKGYGPSGSSEDDRYNSVSCNNYPNDPTRVDVEQKNGGVNVHGNTGTTYVGTGGVEACGDNGNSWRGRVIVTPNGVKYDGATWSNDPTPADNGCVEATKAGVNQSC
jgi:hypothetical protein